MKKIPLYLCLLFSTTAHAQNVGVGTTIPSEKLQVAGNVKADTAKVNTLQVNNGYIQVTGANKMAFTVTATASNSNLHILNLSYPNQAYTDILLVTHSYNPPGAPSEYVTSASSVYWVSNHWCIYLDNTANAILNKSFNVLVIKQ